MSENLTYDPTPKDFPESTPDPEGQLQNQELGNQFHALSSSPEVDTAIQDATGGTATPYGTDLTSTPAYQSQESRVKAMLYDPVNLGGQADQAVLNSQKDSDPQAYRDQVAAFAAVSHLTGAPMSDVVDNYGWYQANLEKQYKFDPTNNVGTFRKNLQGVFEQHDARAGAIDALKSQAVQDAFQDAGNGISAPSLKRFNDWQSAHQDALKGLSDSDKLAAFNSVYKPTQASFNTPDGQLAKKFVDALTGNTPEAKANNYSKEFPTYTDPRTYLRGLPNDQLNTVLGLAQQYVKATHQGQGVGNLGSVYNAFFNSAESFNRYTEVNNLLQAEKARNAATTPEEKQKYQDQYNDILLTQKVRTFDQNVVNAPPVHKGWKGFVSDTAQGLAGFVPQVFPFLVPYMGEIAFGANEIANETLKRLAENPNMSASEANWRALTPAAVNTVVGTKGIHLLGKVAPTVVGVLIHTAGSTLMLSAGNLAKTLYAQLENAWNKDINAGEDFAQEYWDIFKNTPSLFIQLGIFGGAMHVLSGGGKVDPEVAKQAAKNAADPMVLKEQGFSHEEATRISELPEDQRLKAITDGWKKRTEEDIKAGEQLRKDNYQQAIDIINSPDAPKLVNNYDGTFHVVTTTPEGETHTVSFSDRDAAETAYTDAMKDHLQAEYDRTMSEGNDWTTATADDAKSVLDEGRTPTNPSVTIHVPDVELTDTSSDPIKTPDEQLTSTVSNAEAQRPITKLNGSLASQTGGKNGTGTVTRVRAATGEELDQLRKEPSYLFADRIARIFGQKLVLYKTESGDAGNGLINTSFELRGYVFLNIDGDRPHLFTLGHELWHSLSEQYPDLAKKLKDQLLPMIKDMGKVDLEKRHYKPQERVDEVIADFLGNNLGNKDMWDRLQKADPTLFKTVAGAIKQWLDTIIQKLRGYQMGSNSHFNDLEKARDLLAQTLHEWATSERVEPSDANDAMGVNKFQRDDEYDPTKENGGVDGLKVKIKEFAESLPDPKSDEIKFHYEKDGIYGLVDNFFRKAFEMLNAKYDEHRASTGSTYIHISIPKEEGDTLENTQELDRENHKITIRDHDVSVFRAREFGSPTKSIKVDNFDTKENVLSSATKLSEHLSNILEPYREYLSEKANPDAVSDTGVAGIKTDALSGEADKSDILALREGKGSALTGSTLPQPDSDVNYSIQARDEAYDAAVKAGDEAEQQRLVDEAAKEAGYETRAYHGTPNGDFQKFEDNGRGFFFTDKEHVAKGYTYKRGLWLSESPNGKVVNTYLKMDNPLEIDAMGSRYNNIRFPGMEWKKTVFGNLPKDAVSVSDAALKAFEMGHDSVIIRNVMDAVDHDDKTRSTVYVVKSAEQIKSADPITRDDQGNVIPLSQRFNSESNDIRFQKNTPIITGKTPPPPTLREKSEETLRNLQRTIRDLPAASPFKKSLLKWSSRSMTSTNEIERAQHEIEMTCPKLVDREGITNWIEAGGDKSLLQFRADNAEAKYKAGYESALHFNPDQWALANKIKATFDILLKRANSWGLDLGTRDNYVPHVYKTEPQAPSGSTPKRLSEFFKFSQERTFDTYHEGESHGYQPETKDISKLLGLYMNDMSNAINSRRFVEELRGLKATDGRPLVSARGSGKDTVTDNGTTHLVYPDAADEGTEDYKKLDQPALHDWKFAGKADDGSMILTKGDLAVHPEIATHLNNALSSSAITRWINSKTENPFLNAVKSTASGFLKAQSYAKGTMLSFSPFHQVQEGIHAIGHRINPFAGLPTIDLRNPAMRDAADHGLMIAHDRLSQSLFMEGVGDNNSNLITMGLRKLGWGLSTKAADTVDAYQHYLFSQYIPSLKFQTYTHILERNMERYAKDLAKGTVDEWQVKNLSARQSNAAYGHLNYTDMGHNPTIRHALQIILLAPDFLEARARFVAQAAKGLVGGKVGAEQLQALAFLAIVQFVGARIFNKLTNDDYEWEHPFEIRVGNKYYGLRSVPEDMYKLATNTTGFIGGRISPIFGRFVQEGVFGVNYRGEHTTVGDAIADIIAGIVPMSMQSMVGQWTQTGKANPISWWEQMLTSAGVQIHRYSPITTMYPLAKKWVHANYPENDQKGSYPVSKFQQLRYALEDSNDEAVAKQMKILDESGMSHHEITKGFTASVNHPFTGSRATDKQWVKTLDEDNQQRYKAAVERKKEILRRYHLMTGSKPVSTVESSEQIPE